jgi:hypothetical protein
MAGRDAVKILRNRKSWKRGFLLGRMFVEAYSDFNRILIERC